MSRYRSRHDSVRSQMSKVHSSKNVRHIEQGEPTVAFKNIGKFLFGDKSFRIRVFRGQMFMTEFLLLVKQVIQSRFSKDKILQLPSHLSQATRSRISSRGLSTQETKQCPASKQPEANGEALTTHMFYYSCNRDSLFIRSERDQNAIRNAYFQRAFRMVIFEQNALRLRTL